MVTAHKQDLAALCSGMEEEGRMAGPATSGHLASGSVLSVTSFWNHTATLTCCLWEQVTLSMTNTETH